MPEIDLEAIQEYGVDLERRRVYLQGDIVYPGDQGPEDGTGGGQVLHVDNVIRSLLALDAAANAPIELWIHSGGGDVDEMFGLHDVVRSLRSRVTTIGYGTIQSAAVLLLACGDSRICLPATTCMVHAFLVFGENKSGTNYFVMEKRMRECEKQMRLWARLMESYTKHTRRWWWERMAGEYECWLVAKDLLRHGVVDRVTSLT